ncbi:MAG: hypothetical protein Kow006_26860 [Gammaproteobacteria bacterium]
MIMPNRKRTSVLVAVMLAFALTGWTHARAEENAAAQPLDQEVQSLKEELLELNRDLFILEEELLAPSDTQVSVFVSMDIGRYFSLDSVQLTLDDKVVTHYLYTPREIEALHRGGVHRLYIGNLKSGEHEIVAFFVGRGPKGRDFRRGATIRFTKELGPKYLELKIVDNEGRQQPEFSVKEWE